MVTGPPEDNLLTGFGGAVEGGKPTATQANVPSMGPPLRNTLERGAQYLLVITGTVAPI